VTRARVSACPSDGCSGGCTASSSFRRQIRSRNSLRYFRYWLMRSLAPAHSTKYSFRRMVAHAGRVYTDGLRKPMLKATTSALMSWRSATRLFGKGRKSRQSRCRYRDHRRRSGEAAEIDRVPGFHSLEMRGYGLLYTASGVRAAHA
jgi:hypothetical protein